MRILFVKTSSLGDVIHHCPAVSDVRRQFPHALVDWVVEESFAGIPQMHPAIRTTIRVAIRRWRRHLLSASVRAEMRAFHRALRAQRYDYVIDTQGLLKSALITFRARGARHGYNAQSAREPFASRFYDVAHAIARDMHAVERNRTLTAAALGIQRSGRCDYGLVPNAAGTSTGRAPFCVLLSMTSRADKLWPESSWADLIKAMAAHGVQSILPWGNAPEQARCRRIVELAGSGVVPPVMPIEAIADMLSQAQAAVGVDTGLSHLATALQVPTVGIYVASDPRLTGLHGDGPVANLGGPGRTPSVRDVMNALETLP
jgi:heptosyltransferase I